MTDDLDLVRELLDRCSTLALATTAGCAPLFYARVHGSFRLCWVSSDTSAHSRALDGNPKCAVAIYPEVHDWRSIRGVQMRGLAQRSDKANDLLPPYRERFGLGREFAVLIQRSALWVFVPDSMRYIDSSHGVGWRREWAIIDGTTADPVPL